MQIWIVLLNGQLMELQVERTDTVAVTLSRILARIPGLPLDKDGFRLVAHVGTSCERMMKGNQKLQSYNTYEDDSFTLVHLLKANGEMAPSLPDDATEHNIRINAAHRSRSRSPVAPPWR